MVTQTQLSQPHISVLPCGNAEQFSEIIEVVVVYRKQNPSVSPRMVDFFFLKASPPRVYGLPEIFYVFNALPRGISTQHKTAVAELFLQISFN